MGFAPPACPGSTELAAYFDAGLAPDRLEEIRAHIDRCDDCLDSLVGLLRGSQLGGAVDPGAELGEIEAGTRVGPFELRELIGTGNLGRVYAAFDPRLERTVALKLLGTRREHPSWTDRLVAEAQTMARIRHPNVCTVHEVGRDRELVYIAMERIEGETLREAGLSERPPAETLAILANAARGLHAAHEQGITHRDFKPDNATVEERHGERRVVVCDFGLAAAGSAARPARDPADPGETLSGLVGSPAYMAPEQLDGAPVDRAADIWAFAVTAWESLSGSRPFEASTLAELREAQRRPPVWPDGVDAPASVRALLSRCLSEDPGDRPGTAAEVADALEAAPPRGRRRVATLIAAAAFAAAGIGIGASAMAGADGGEADGCDPLEHRGWPVHRQTWLDAAGRRLPGWTVDAIAERIDGRAERWRRQRGARCEAAPIDRVAAALWSRCHRAARLVSAEYLAAAIEVSWPNIEALVPAFAALPAPSYCAGDEGLRGGVAAASPAADQVRRLLARVEVMGNGGAAAAAWHPLLSTARSLSRSIGDPALAADVAFAVAEREPADSTAGRDRQWREVVAAAETSGNQRAGARAWLALANLWAVDEPLDRRAAAALEQADWAIARLGDPPPMRSAWHRARASHAWKTGDYAAARGDFAAAIERAGDDDRAASGARLAMARLAVMDEDHARARALYEAVLADPRTRSIDPIDRARLHSAYAEVLYQTDELDAGLEVIDAALEIARGAVDDADPLIGELTLVRGMLELEKGEAAASLASVDAALSRFRAAYGSRHSKIGAALNLRAAAQAHQKDHRAALETAREARRLYTELYGREHESAIFASLQLAENLKVLDRLDEARAVFSETLPLARDVMGDSHSFTNHVRFSLAGVLDDLGDEARAVELAEKALAEIRASQQPAPYVGQAEHQLADILADSDPRRALALAESAIARYGDGAFWASDRALAAELVARLRR
jgi:hypothetical protein